MNEEGFPLKILRDIERDNWVAVEQALNQSELALLLGFRVSLDDPLRPRCEVSEIKSLHRGGIGQHFINGAIISALFDYLFGLTALPYLSEGYFATSNVNVRFVKPVKDEPFNSIATSKERIGNSIFSEATLYDFNGQPCVHATGEIRVGIT